MKTDITVILDRSGSMSSMKDYVEEAFNKFLSEQAEVEGDCTINLVQFDDIYEEVYKGVRIQNAPKLCLNPRNTTALYDAIGKTINSIGERLRKLSEHKRPDQVLITVITDGFENASREFNYNKIKEMIDHQTSKYNWKFAYIGASVGNVERDAHINYAQSYGFNTMMSTACGTNRQDWARTMHVYSSCVTDYRKDGTEISLHQ